MSARPAFAGLPPSWAMTRPCWAHRYALSLDIDTLVLGVKNRQELVSCVAAAEAGPLSQELIDRIDRVVQRTAAP
jgi:aryl-alcohol dehydrogenase-like predicted oxidoreductase